MDLAAYVVRQMEGVRSILGSLIADVSAQEWFTSPMAGHNPVGFTAWHVPSIQDWALTTWMRNIEPVRSRPEWRAKGMMASFLPIGMGLDGAVDVARATRPEDVLAYADAVLEEARSYLATFSPEKFDTVPPNRAHLADIRFQHEGYLQDTDNLYELPYWRLFAGACTGHCRGHLGELELGLAMIRGT